MGQSEVPALITSLYNSIENSLCTITKNGAFEKLRVTFLNYSSPTYIFYHLTVRFRTQETLTSHHFVESTGRCVVFGTGPEVEQKFGFKPGDLVRYGVGDLQGRDALIMGERGKHLWRYDPELEEAHPFAGRTQHDILNLHNLCVVAQRQPLPACAPFLFLAGTTVKPFHAGAHPTLARYGLQRGGRYKITLEGDDAERSKAFEDDKWAVLSRIERLVVCVIGVLHSEVAKEDPDVYFAVDCSGAFVLPCEQYFASDLVTTRLLFTSDISSYSPKNTLVTHTVTFNDEPTRTVGLDITQHAFDTALSPTHPKGSVSCGTVLLSKGEEHIACGVAHNELYVLRAGQVGVDVLVHSFTVMSSSNRKARIPVVALQMSQKERTLFYYIGASGAVRIFDRNPVLLRQWGVSADDLVSFGKGKYKGSEGAIVGLRKDTIWVDMRSNGVAYPVSSSPQRFSKEHAPSVVGVSKLTSFYG